MVQILPRMVPMNKRPLLVYSQATGKTSVTSSWYTPVTGHITVPVGIYEKDNSYSKPGKNKLIRPISWSKPLSGNHTGKGKAQQHETSLF